MSGWDFPEGLFTLLANHHSTSQPSTASWELASPSRRLLGHVSHHARWSASLMPKGSCDACTSQGIATFLLAVSRHREPHPVLMPALVFLLPRLLHLVQAVLELGQLCGRGILRPIILLVIESCKKIFIAIQHHGIPAGI